MFCIRTGQGRFTLSLYTRHKGKAIYGQADPLKLGKGAVSIGLGAESGLCVINTIKNFFPLLDPLNIQSNPVIPVS